MTEDGDIDRVRDADPDPEQDKQEHAELEHGAEGRCAQHLDRIPCIDLLAALTAAAEFVEADRGKGTDQGKPGGQRKQQRQDRIAEDHPEQDETENRIDHADDDRVTRHRLEIFPAQAQHLFQVEQADLANGIRNRLTEQVPLDDLVGIKSGHAHTLL
ncbi:hypothetical protein BRDID11002_10200 [Bradyrhizobium diazoefficiens]